MEASSPTTTRTAEDAPLTEPCDLCAGTGLVRDNSRSLDAWSCPTCDESGVVLVDCEICGDPATGREDGDPYCCEAHRAELEEQQRAILEDRLRASLEVSS